MFSVNKTGNKEIQKLAKRLKFYKYARRLSDEQQLSRNDTFVNKETETDQNNDSARIYPFLIISANRQDKAQLTGVEALCQKM